MSGFDSPNYTQVPNDLFEKHMPTMGYAELKVVMVLIRETFGYHRTKKRMSIRRLAQATGLTPRNAYNGAIEAVNRGLLSMTQDGGVTIWSVVVEDTKESTVSPANTPNHETVSPTDTPSKKEKNLKEKNLPTSGKKPNTYQSSVGLLESKFSDLTGLPLPKRDSEKDRRAASERWWVPLGEILTMCDKDTDQAWRLIESSYKKLTTDKMTVSAPKSLINTAIALRAQGQGRKVINIG